MQDDTKILEADMIKSLLSLFPEFKNSKEWMFDCDQDLVYMVYGAFTTYLTRYIDSVQNAESDLLVIRAYQHFDELISSKKEYESTLGVTEVVESLSQRLDTLKLMKKMFSKESLEWVDGSLKNTGLVRSVSEIPE